ncbi:hypothetical protein EYC84_001728 [Monilinia fructicola]|uniref:Uncharacterized protein n=1 Tax=Monilinia fructicola TaxID=38448 RepID=A0A5M9JTJ8_MONFR|nr:hypothetical protein EYC84_001728 [Monilinia fructicola]
MTTFKSLHAQLLKIPAPLLPPVSPHDPNLTSEIASLQLHPTLETALHLLNLDLPSAHFLARHMQSAPAFEGIDLLKAVGKGWSDMESVAGRAQRMVAGRESLDNGQKFLDAIQKFKETQGKEGEKASLVEQSRVEIDGIIKWCVMRKSRKWVKIKSVETVEEESFEERIC